MTQQEIQERNEQIALMLGWEYDIQAEAWYKNQKDHEWGYKIEELKYHSDWNWLMEAVEFIENLDNYYIQIEEKSCYVYDISKFDNIQTNAFIIKDGETKKEAVFIAVSDFAKLYNNKEL